VQDQTTSGKAVDAWVLPDLPTSITARELIRLRVREEVARYHATQPEYFRGLVQPTDAEATLNGYRVRDGHPLDWERQADAACTAFARNGFIMLLGDHEVDDLDEIIDLSHDPEVAFVKLVPLVGG
jgi:hypothetical protein